MYTEFVHAYLNGEPYEYIYVEAPEKLAKEFLKKNFPRIRLEDFYVYNFSTLEDATHIELQHFNVTQGTFLRQPNVKVYHSVEVEKVLYGPEVSFKKPTRKYDFLVIKDDGDYIRVCCDTSYLDELRTFGNVYIQSGSSYDLKIDPRYDREEVISYLKELERNSKKVQ